MRYASIISKKGKQPAIRIAVLVFLVCIILVSLLAEAYILSSAKHNHDYLCPNGCCSTCAHIQAVENLLKQFTIFISGVFFALVIIFAAKTGLYLIGCLCELKVLVKLKIRMNN